MRPQDKTETKTVKDIYIGKYDDVYDRAYITQYWKTTASNVNLGNGAYKVANDISKKEDGNDRYEASDWSFDTTNIKEGDPFKDTQAMYPEANTYHWATAPADYYENHDTPVYTRSWKQNSDGKSKAYFNSLVFALDWYRAQPISEVTVWYKPATYKVVYHTNVPNMGDIRYPMYSDTSLTKNTTLDTNLVFYDDYTLSDPEYAFMNVDAAGQYTSNDWATIESQAANQGYVFDHWAVSLNANDAIGNKANDSSCVCIYPTKDPGSLHFNINTDDRAPFAYNNVMKKGTDNTIHVAAIWKKSSYHVVYNSNEGDNSKIFPKISTLTQAAQGDPLYREGWLSGNETDSTVYTDWYKAVYMCAW